MLRLVPASWIRWVGRLQFRVPLLRPLIEWAARRLRQGEHVLVHGVGKGLRFDPGGVLPGFALGTTEMEEQEILARYLDLGKVFYTGTVSRSR